MCQFDISLYAGRKLFLEKINEAYERVMKSDVKYHFVIDMKALGK